MSPPDARAIRDVFGIFDAAGLRPPAVMSDPGRVEGVIAVWRAALADCTGFELRTAAIAYVGSTASSWYPPPGALREHIDRPTAESAWGDLLADVQVFGASGVDLDQLDPATAAGVEAVGGLRALGDLSVSDLAAARAAFRRGWEAAEKRERRRMYEAAITGLAITGSDPRRIG